ncbi:MAG: nickel-responsive transcriptional regulator NikR [Pseudomonadota bacterium]
MTKTTKKTKPSSGVERFGVSIEKQLLEKFDGLIRRRKYRNRSEAIRDLMRSALIEEEWRGGKKDVMGLISLLYDHHTRLLQSKLTKIQHDHHLKIVSTLHVHMDHRSCLEVMVVRGSAAEIQSLANRLISVRGVKHGKVIATSKGAMI